MTSYPVLPVPGIPELLTFGESMVSLRSAGPLSAGGSLGMHVAGAESNVAVVLGRLAGAALTALGTACWFARDQTGAARGLMASMLLYNIIAAGLLTFVAVVEGLQSPLTWPVVLLHVAMMVWCVLGLRRAGGS